MIADFQSNEHVAPRAISARFAYRIRKAPVAGVIPFGLKVIYTIFVCALVPIYWRQYAPANFLWFSDIALLALVPSLWPENALLISMIAVSLVFFEALRNIDFFFRLATGKPLITLSAYMFDPRSPLFIRGLSAFHIVLPVLLLWTLHRLGYDERAFLWQTTVALVVLPLSYLVSNPQENVNWVHGFGQIRSGFCPGRCL